MISYNAHLVSDSQENIDLTMQLLNDFKIIVNEASVEQFGKEKISITKLHKKFYYKTRAKYPETPSQVVIKAEQECLASYRSIKSNKHKIDKPFEKTGLSIRLDKRLYSKTDSLDEIRITTYEGRKNFKIKLYPKLNELLNKYEYQDPLIFVNEKGQLMISLTFDNEPKVKEKPNLSLGVDVGMRRSAACSDGRLIIDKEFNKQKRKLRYLKRCLQSKGTKSARKHLKKLRRKEKNKNKNQTHLIANEILKTNANVIALENLKGIKAKRFKTQNKNAISQVPMFELRRILTYKAKNMGKHICLVSPAYTSQTDCINNKREGERKGCRFYAVSGLVYDADLNAAINIAVKSKHPVSKGNFLDGQGIVNSPIVCQPSPKEEPYKPTNLFVGS
jgi:IS605 OrfB family transposase